MARDNADRVGRALVKFGFYSEGNLFSYQAQKKTNQRKHT
jgi:hypothetical protein